MGIKPTLNSCLVKGFIFICWSGIEELVYLVGVENISLDKIWVSDEGIAYLRHRYCFVFNNDKRINVINYTLARSLIKASAE